MEILKFLVSSSIAWAAYDKESRVLHVRYVGNDNEYEYEKVSENKWDRLKKAESKGKFINFYIKPFHKVTYSHV